MKMPRLSLYTFVYDTGWLFPDNWPVFFDNKTRKLKRKYDTAITGRMA
uniref:Uncharacterized protein n=1 Tax=Escherichia coli TaxID=562 RepID=A0A7L8KAJ5_ECOLX|nr:hypothetical protein [Escherichia coli]UCK65660.1 hypothetical protein [Providencia rettgeri]